MKKDDLKYLILPSKNIPKKYSNLYNEAYDCWQRVWSDTFKALHPDSPEKAQLYSDSFTRQDFIGSIFQGSKCIALTFFRYSDANYRSFYEDSYFSNWNELALKSLTKRGKNILVCSYFTVAPEVRGIKEPFSIKDLLTGLSILVGKNFACDAMTAAMRINRNVHKVLSEWGCETIQTMVPSGHGDYVELMKIDQETKCEVHKLFPIVLDLWNNRTRITESSNTFDYNDNSINFPIIEAK